MTMKSENEQDAGPARVLLVKRLERDGTSHNGFTYPDSGPVKPLHCSRKPTCESGGIFGWLAGKSLGDGKPFDPFAPFLVLSARADQVVRVGREGKVKVAADTPDEVDCRVVYRGTWQGAMEMVLADWQPAERGPVTVGKEVLARHDDALVVTASYHSVVVAAEDMSMAVARRHSSTALVLGYSSVAVASDVGSVAAAADSRSVAVCISMDATASVSGNQSVAAATRSCCIVQAEGHGSIGCLTQEGTVEVRGEAVGVVTADTFRWLVHKGAMVFQTWYGVNGLRQEAVLKADELGLKEGEVHRIVCGVVRN
jgi:hypothetical protein